MKAIAHLITSLVALLLLVVSLSAGQSSHTTKTQAPDSLLIKNIYLISREDTLGDILVSVLVIDKKLELITRDTVSFGSKVYTLDGNHGYLMGNVVLGQPPSFVVLDGNPRKDFDLFLNTDLHTRFAMNRGVIVKNKLSIAQVTTNHENRRIAWTSYQPPAMAVPINYYNSHKWNKFDTKLVSGLFNGVLALDRLHWISQNQQSKSQVGDLSSNSIGAIRAIRFGLVGTFNFKKPWVYTFFVTNSSFDHGYDGRTDNTLKLYDLRVDIPLPGKINMSIGKQKEPISMERLTTLVFLPIQERQASADAFLPARNYGVLFNGLTFKGRGTWAAGIFKNFIDSDTTYNATPTQFTGRITALPLLTDDESNLIHVGFGLRYSTANLPLAGKADAEFFQAPVFASVNNLNARYLVTNVIEAYWRKGPFLLGGEYIGNYVPAVKGSVSYPNGWNVTGSWIVTGEMRKYRKRSGIFDPVPVSKPVGLGGFGALELVARYSTIDLSNSGLNGGIMQTYSLGANWWPSAKAQFGANYRFINLDRFDVVGNSSGLNFRLMLILD